MKIKSRSAQEIAEKLIGLQGSLKEVLTQEELDNEELIEQVNEIAYQCGTCEIWVESEEINEDGDCMECAGDYKD